jgi:glycerol-3-phosphate acyltransferase PlsX
VPAVPLAAPPAQGLSRLRLLRKASGDRAGRPLTGGGAVATIAVDTLGADLGVVEVVTGALEAAKGGVRPLLFGPEKEIRAAAATAGDGAFEVVDAPVAISNSEEPARAVRSKPDASIVQVARAVADGRADAAVSAGPTGAALAASVVHIRRLEGVYRPAVAVVLPVPSGRVLFLDVGANVEVRPEHLVQFAYMGAAFSEAVLGVERPRVGLLSVGEEPEKGRPEVVVAHRQLASGKLRFAGNVEGADVPAGNVDVVVTDGFTGNVALKLMEGTSRALVGAVRDAARSGVLSGLGGLLLKPKLGALRERLDPEVVGGAYLLGLRRLVVICHGSSSRRAIASAVALAERGVTERVVERTAQALAAASVQRGSVRDERDSSATSDRDIDDARAGDPGPPSVSADTVRGRR